MDSRPCWGHLCSPLQVSLRSPRCSDYGISPTIRSPGFRSVQPTPDGGLRTLCPPAAQPPHLEPGDSRLPWRGCGQGRMGRRIPKPQPCARAEQGCISAPHPRTPFSFCKTFSLSRSRTPHGDRGGRWPSPASVPCALHPRTGNSSTRRCRAVASGRVGGCGTSFFL